MTIFNTYLLIRKTVLEIQTVFLINKKGNMVDIPDMNNKQLENMEDNLHGTLHTKVVQMLNLLGKGREDIFSVDFDIHDTI